MSLLPAVWTLVAGAVFGLALAAPPGPMNAVIAEESVRRGWLAGFTAGLGAMTADFVFFVLSLAGVVAFLDDAPTVRAVMILAGGLVMLYFASGAARDLRGTTLSDDGPTAAVGEGGTSGDERDADGTGPGTRGFRRALVLALTNPYQILFWLTVGVGLLRPGTVDVLAVVPVVGADLAGVLVVKTGSPALLVGLFCGIVVWIVGFPATLVRIGRRVDAFAPAVAAVSALVLAGFGLTFLWTATTTLL
jgi:threonine/homoserine/homoserine lactone efflux protein